MLSIKERTIRTKKLQTLMKEASIDAMLITSNVNLLYIFGEVFVGAAFLAQEGDVMFFVRKPQIYTDHKEIKYIRKIEQIEEFISVDDYQNVAFEIDEESYSDIERQKKIFHNASIANATSILRKARMIKTDVEVANIRSTAKKHIEVYKSIPKLYKDGMTDVELQIEIEREMRLNGSVGLFRTFGNAMEIHMGSLISGNNADAPSPYDFAMGGAGSEALPLGSNGTLLEKGNPIMIDMAGNYGTYLSDVTRTFSVDKVNEEAYRLHNLSILMHKEIMMKAKAGDSCADIYNKSIEMAKEHNALQYFMGYTQQAAFVGHGLGLQINEMPVLTGRSKDILQENMVIAYEPKFVLAPYGAIGIENTYLIHKDFTENISELEERIIDIRTGEAY